ncbi:MAG: YraN family protein [Chitinophagales bacterium]
MAHHLELGAWGENLAVQHLKTKGYIILATNWRYKRAEVDIIVQQNEEVVFVEVKTRRSTHYGYPELSVGAKKKGLLVKAAGAYIYEKNIEGEIRFDIIAIVTPDQENYELKHIEDAFFPYDNDF